MSRRHHGPIATAGNGPERRRRSWPLQTSSRPRTGCPRCPALGCPACAGRVQRRATAPRCPRCPTGCSPISACIAASGASPGRRPARGWARSATRSGACASDRGAPRGSEFRRPPDRCRAGAPAGGDYASAMQRFAALFTALDQTTRTTRKVAALAAYFADAPEPDRLWTIALLSGRRPRRAIQSPRLREWAAERAGLPAWLIEESYPVVGDLAETLSLILPPPERHSDRSLSDWIAGLIAVAPQPEAARKAFVLEAWDSLGATERFVFNKLMTGGFRMGVSQKLMTRALAQATGRDEADLAHRLMGDWTPATTSYADLIEGHDPAASLSRPYPFYLAYQLDDAPAALGDPADWTAEYKWDGIR